MSSMAERKAVGRKKSEPPTPSAAESKRQRDTFLQTFFQKGAEFTHDLLRENERLRKQSFDLEQENAQLRTQLASNDAIRDLLRKVEELEREKSALLSSMYEAEAISTRFCNRQSEMEDELHKLANLYVASYQLHSTLSLTRVFSHLRELLAQLVGARAHALYLHDPTKNVLLPVASDGVPLSALPAVPVAENSAGTRATDALLTVERVFLTGVPIICEDLPSVRDIDPAKSPAACVPMRFDDRVVGVIVVYTLLEQKPQFVPVDYELFKMLGAHAATALLGALLYRDAEGKLPGLEVLLQFAEGSP